MRKSEQLAQRLIQGIIRSNLQPGDRLAVFKELCATYHTNPTTLNQALDQLEKSGIVRREPRRGIFLCNVPESSKVKATPPTAGPETAKDQNSFLHRFQKTSNMELAFSPITLTTLRFYTIETTTPRQFEAWKKVIAAARQALPNIKIELVHQGEIRRKEAIAKDLRVIDVVTGSREHFPGKTAMEHFSGFDRDEILKHLNDKDYFQICSDAFSWNNKTYGLPLSIIATSSYSLKDLTVHQSSPHLHSRNFIAEMLYNSIPFLENNTQLFHLQTEAMKDYLRQSKHNLYCVYSSIKSLTDNTEIDERQHIVQELLNGHLKEVRYASYLLPMFSGDELKSIKMTPWCNNIPGYAPALATGIFINNHTENREKALDFALFCSSREAQQIFASYRSNIPAHKETALKTASTTAYPEGATEVVKTLIDRQSLFEAIYLKNSDNIEMWYTVSRSLYRYYQDQASLTDVLKQCEAFLNKQLSKKPNDFTGILDLCKKQNLYIH
jgi:DNA-binding transcriptional regulator YhcF (GntR family)